MAEDAGFASLRDAVAQAKVGTDSDLDFTEAQTVAAGKLIKQLHVAYKSGNEYLRLDKFYKALQACGEVEVFEFRGRGRAHEKPTLVADVKIAGHCYQVIYLLPDGGPDA
jgi:hypothetical protein